MSERPNPRGREELRALPSRTAPDKRLVVDLRDANERGVVMRNRILLQLLILLAFGPALARASGNYSVSCQDVALLAASGYPGPKRSYKLRGSCRVYAQVVKTKSTGVFPPEHTSTNVLVLKDQFVAEAAVKWNGTTGETGEGLIIRGQKVATKISCINDPFISNTSCSGATYSGNVGDALMSAVIQTQQPIFARAVNPSLAEALSKQGGSSKPPPPPPPKKATAMPLNTGKGPAAAGKPVVPSQPVRAGQQPPGGGTVSGKPATSLVVMPTPTAARGGAKLFRVQPTPTPTAAAGRGPR